MRILAAVDTVHTAGALCDYLGDRVGPDDTVVAVTVHESGEQSEADGSGAADGGATDPGAEERDGQEALNVIAVRLAVPAVETVERRGDVAGELLDAAAAHSVDEIVLGRRAGTPDAPEGLGSTAEAVLAGADRPAVVVPAP